MHELSIATAVLNTAIKHAAERPVTVVAVRAGRLRQVVPDSLSFYWEIVARETICEGARLEVQEIEARLRCLDCEHEWDAVTPSFRCPECEAADVMIVAGQELEVDYIEVEEEEPACTGPR
jgi:hydrogenase nickel incorporation protein HypA/HybF